MDIIVVIALNCKMKSERIKKLKSGTQIAAKLDTIL
ncbi:MAG: hypothetical protein EZS28_051152, partial [Streblomastix strix]